VTIDRLPPFVGCRKIGVSEIGPEPRKTDAERMVELLSTAGQVWPMPCEDTVAGLRPHGWTMDERPVEVPPECSRHSRSSRARDKALPSPVCTSGQPRRAPARYPRRLHHDRQPSAHRHPSTSTADEKTKQIAGPDCRSTGERTGCARGKSQANVFTVSHHAGRKTASTGGLTRVTAQ